MAPGDQCLPVEGHLVLDLRLNAAGCASAGKQWCIAAAALLHAAAGCGFPAWESLVPSSWQCDVWGLLQEDIYLLTTDSKETWLSGAASTNIQRISVPEKVGRNLTGAPLCPQLPTPTTATTHARSRMRCWETGIRSRMRSCLHASDTTTSQLHTQRAAVPRYPAPVRAM